MPAFFRVLVSFLIVVSVSTAAQGDDEALVRKIDELARLALVEPGAVGLSIAVGRGGEIILAKGYGLAEVEHDVQADDDTPFRIGSITKAPSIQCGC